MEMKDTGVVKSAAILLLLAVAVCTFLVKWPNPKSVPESDAGPYSGQVAHVVVLGVLAVIALMVLTTDDGGWFLISAFGILAAAAALLLLLGKAGDFFLGMGK